MNIAEFLEKHHDDSGCDKNCKDCPMLIHHKGKEMCFYEWERQWKVWNEKRHKEFEEFLKNYEGER